MLSKIFQKHKIWIDIVSSFGCNKDTAEDIVQEMYIRIQKNLNNGLDINYDDDYNYYYIFKTLKSMFIDLKRKESKIIILNIEDKPSYFNDNYDVYEMYWTGNGSQNVGDLSWKYLDSGGSVFANGNVDQATLRMIPSSSFTEV